MYVPNYVEGIVFLIDTGEKSMFDIPYGALKSVIDTLSTHYPESLSKIYIINPSTSLYIVWKIILQFIPKEAHSKIEFIKKYEIHQKLSTEIHDFEIPKIYGGKNNYQYPYWPPRQNKKYKENFNFRHTILPLFFFGIKSFARKFRFGRRIL